MEQRKEIVRQYVSKGLRVSKAVLIAAISKSTYYYIPNGRPKGKRPSTETLLGDRLVPNDLVVHRINNILENDFIDYGYQNMHQELRKLGFRINHKKVYRLMKDNRLLHPESKANAVAKRAFVKFTSPRLERPFATIEVDIKYIYLQGIGRHAYLATAFDTFTRIAIDWEIGYQMKNGSISKLINRCLTRDFVQPYIHNSNLTIRSDNGPQFVSLELGKALKNLPVSREFIRPATPEQNGHIESFHNTLKKLVTDRFEFFDIDDAKQVLERFYQTYNHKRIMKSILYCSPIEFLREWQEGKVGIGVRNQRQFFFRERQPLS